jgi:hypothetical protein
MSDGQRLLWKSSIAFPECPRLVTRERRGSRVSTY